MNNEYFGADSREFAPFLHVYARKCINICMNIRIFILFATICTKCEKNYTAKGKKGRKDKKGIDISNE